MPNSYSWYTTKHREISPDEIHQILSYGSLADIQSLKRGLGEQKITELFLNHPKKIYTAEGLNFIQKFILHLSSLDEQKYLKATSRNTR